ncbi:hypothetical protein PRECH8_11110 [Insulibacter thermoxylanivorax]|uniref:Helicase XPB/Ssl2 N-terminal domain-containing protein n=1 Tax=Insulibacter thermoxylanivorax TaxID=2749268 RepID=A0A916QC12_9BACL|nr:helicase-associated domain-containing protein [Insulibacter thermoxylanivorax]GFR37815.1 hypothetical protein PRECH8_11110 [Insulibacter thermoxylanivorax]
MRKGQASKYEALDPLECRALDLIHRCFGHSPFSLDTYLQRAGEAGIPAEWHLGLLKLCRKQLVHTLSRTWGERQYQLPVSIYMDYMQQPEDAPFASPLLLAADPHRRMGEILFLVFLEIEAEPLRLTRQGRFQKRSLDLLIAKVAKCGKEDEGARRQVLEAVDLGLRMRVLVMEPPQVRVDERRLSAWLDMDAAAREEQMFLLWYRVHSPRQPLLQRWTAALWKFTGEKWCLDDAVIGDAGDDEETRSELKAWLDHLQRSGWLESAVDEMGQRWIRRVPPLETMPQTLIVQRDYEIIAYPHTCFKVQHALHRFAERLACDAVLRFRLTAGSVRRASEQGWDAERILRFLEAHSMDEIARSIRQTIREWEAGRFTVRLVPGMILQTNREQDASWLAAHAEQLGLMRLNEQVWFAARAEPSQLASLLRECGIEAAMDAPAGKGELEEAALDLRHDQGSEASVSFIDEAALAPQAPGLFTPRDASAVHALAPPKDVIEEVYPDVEQIPSIWYEQYRRYHPSTSRALLEQAIRWRTAVRLRAADKEFDFVPSSIVDTGTSFKVYGSSGAERKQLELRDIEQLKLLMPGFWE